MEAFPDGFVPWLTKLERPDLLEKLLLKPDLLRATAERFPLSPTQEVRLLSVVFEGVNEDHWAEVL